MSEKGHQRKSHTRQEEGPAWGPSYIEQYGVPHRAAPLRLSGQPPAWQVRHWGGVNSGLDAGRHGRAYFMLPENSYTGLEWHAVQGDSAAEKNVTARATASDVTDV